MCGQGLKLEKKGYAICFLQKIGVGYWEFCIGLW